jgi:hypothetical protein
LAKLFYRFGSALVLGATAFIFMATGGQGNRRAGFAATPAGRNAWRGITPLQSTSADVARALSITADSNVAESDGPFKVDGGEVTFYYLTADQAKLYHASPSMVGRVFSIYFKRNPPLERIASQSIKGFKRCIDDMDKRYYYLVSMDGGLAYQVRRGGDEIEYEIYQPVRADIQKLKLNTACVF